MSVIDAVVLAIAAAALVVLGWYFFAPRRAHHAESAGVDRSPAPATSDQHRPPRVLTASATDGGAQRSAAAADPWAPARRRASVVQRPANCGPSSPVSRVVTLGSAPT